MKLKNPEVRIEPTNLCDYACAMCPRETHDRPRGCMAMPFYRGLVDQVVKMGAEQITLVNFGEPFMDPTLEDKIRYAARTGLRTYLITNASLFHLPSPSRFASDFGGGKTMTKIEAAVRAGLTEMRLSFHGTTKDAYERVMAGGRFEQVEANIRLAAEMRDRFGKEIASPTTGRSVKSPEISAYFLDFDRNGDGTSKEVLDFLDYTRPFADYIEVWRPHNFGDGRCYRDIKKEKRSCGRPDSGPLQIDWDGTVVPCCFDYNERIPLGNAALQTVEEILKGPAYAKLREAHATKQFHLFPYCENCDQLCERNEALVLSTHPKHQNRPKEDIMRSPNTWADFRMG